MKYKVFLKKYREVVLEAESLRDAEEKAKSYCKPDEMVAFADCLTEQDEEAAGEEEN